MRIHSIASGRANEINQIFDGKIISMSNLFIFLYHDNMKTCKPIHNSCLALHPVPRGPWRQKKNTTTMRFSWCSKLLSITSSDTHISHIQLWWLCLSAYQPRVEYEYTAARTDKHGEHGEMKHSVFCSLPWFSPNQNLARWQRLSPAASKWHFYYWWK